MTHADARSTAIRLRNSADWHDSPENRHGCTKSADLMRTAAAAIEGLLDDVVMSHV